MPLTYLTPIGAPSAICEQPQREPVTTAAPFVHRASEAVEHSRPPIRANPRAWRAGRHAGFLRARPV
jgi:hypothetical protein